MSRQRSDNPTRPRHHRFALEPRQLFDGAAVVEAASHADNPLDAQHHDNAPDASKAVFVPPATAPAPASITAPAPTDATPAHEVYVVDSHVQNWQSLVSQLPEGSRVLVLDSEHSGLEQINDALKNDKNITAIHIISHGASDEITLGSDKLNDQTIGLYQQQLEKLGEKLTTDGDILLYGCNVTSKDTVLITRMADYTHADVAASSDETGSVAKAADWTLESHTGVIETRSLELAYDGVLQAPELTTSTPDMVVSEPSSLHPGAETGSFSGLTINASDENVAISVTLTNDAAGDLVNGTQTGKTLEFVGSVADAQAWLNSLKFTASDTELGNQSASTDVQFYILSLSGNDSLVTHITITPSNDPATVPNKTLTVPENNGSGTVISDQILTAVDPDVAAGAQSASQIVYSLTVMPQYGYLTLNGTRLGVGSVYTQQDVQNGALKYVHTATGATQNTTDSFSANVNDGATPIDQSDKVTVTLEIAPENQLPTISGGGIVFEGQPANAANTGNVGQYITADSGGDTQDSELTLTITALPTHGTLYFNGLPVIKGQQISYNDRNQLTYENDGTEGVTQDNFGVTVTDMGGGTDTLGSSDAVIALTIQPVDDDPYLNPDSTLHAQVTTGPNNVVLQPEMLAALDSDSSADRVSFIVDTQGLTHGYLTLNGLLMKSGDTFTMQDLAEGRVVYTQYLAANVGGIDVFNFRVIDHSTALRWNADGTTFTRQGGIWDGETPSDQLTHMQFTIDLVGTTNPNNPNPGDVPILNVPATTTNSEYIGTDVNNSANAPHGVLVEGGSLTLSGTGNITDNTPGMSYVVQGATPDQIVYTFLGSASGQTGLTVLKSDGQGGYQVINPFGTFTQADLNQGLISIRHDGGENFMFDGSFSVSAGQVTLDARGNPVAVTWNPVMKVFVTPINDAPVIAGSSNTVLAEGETVVITNSQLRLSDPDDANSGTSWEGAPLRPDGSNNYAYNNDATGAGALKFGFLTLPAGGALQYYNGTSWVTITNADIGTLQLDASILKSDGTSGLRFVSNGSEVRSTSFTTYAVDRWGLQSANNATVGITITNVNDGPKIPQNPDSPDIVVPPDSPNLVGGNEGRAPANNPATVVEGSYVQINSSQLQAYDPDSTPEQVQFTVTTTPTHGHLAYSRDGVNFSAIGNGSTFTQADINNGYIYYLNNGDEITGNGLNADGFNFTLSDGDKEQSGNHFAINVTPTNDKPTVTAPSGPIDIGTTQSVSGFTITDPDITGTNSAINILQTTVRLLHRDGSAFSQAEYNGIVLAANAASGATITGGTNGYLVLTGTVAQINSALSGLSVRFPNDRNEVYQVQVIADDRLRSADGQLTGGANGGPVNQPATPGMGSSPGLVDTQNYNWYQNAVPAANGNITANQVTINASSVNDPGHLTIGNTNKTTYEDQPTFIGGDFVITDVESSAFGKPVTVTLNVAQGQLGIGGLANDSSTEINGVTIQGDNSGTLTLTGTADAIQALLNDSVNGPTYLSAANANHDQNGTAAGDVTLNVHLDTSTATVGDTSGFPPADVQVALTIIPVNDPPTVTAPSDSVLLDNNAPGGNNVGGFVIGDPDISDAGGVAAGENDIVQVTVRITDENGNPLSVSQYRDQQNSAITISSLNTTSGVIVQTASQDGINPPSNGQNSPLVITGTVAQINAYLAQLQVSMRGLILDDADQYFRVEVIVDDRLRDTSGNLTGGANGGDNVAANGVGTTPPLNTVISPYAAIPAGLEQNVASTYRTVFQSSINDPAQIKLGGNPQLEANESNATVTLPPITISDSDAGSQTMTVTVKLPNGFTFVAPTGSGGTVTGANTDTLTFTGSYTQINSYLAALRVTLPDAPGTPARSDWNGSFGVTVTVNDGGNSGSRPDSLPGSTNNPQQDPGQVSYADGTSSVLITTRAFTFTVKPVNDAPVVVGTPDITIPTLEEDTLSGAVAGKTVGELFAGKFNDARDSVNNSGNGGTGGSSADNFYGVAITNVTTNAAQGEWQYSLDGTNWLAVGNRSDSNALVLTANSSLRFVPAANYFGIPATLGVRLVETNDNADVSTTPAVPGNGTVTNISGAGGHGGTSIYSEALVTLSTVVSNINDRPTLGNTTITIAEDTNGTQTIGNIFQSVYSDATDNQTAIAGGGDASSPLGYIAIYGDTTDPTKGHWEYFNGTTWSAIPSDVTASNALVLASDTQIRFVPLPDYNGTVSGGLQLRASDTTDTALAGITNGRVNFFDFAKDTDPTSHWSNTASLSVNITPVTDAQDDTFSTHSNVPLVMPGSDLLLNDTFSNGDKAVTLVTSPTNGTLSYVNGVLTYTPNPGFVGSDSYIYTVTSGGVEERATVNINVTNLAPVVGNEIKTIDEDNVATGNVLTNDSDPDGDTFTVKNFTVEGVTYLAGATAILADSHGTLTMNADGNYTYTPGGDWHGDIVVSYVVTDGNSNGDTAGQLGVHVASVIDAHDNIEIEHTGTVITTDVLANDTFVNTDKTVTQFTQPENGVVTRGPGNTLIYTPNPGFIGADKYTYTVVSGGIEETANVFIFMTNTPPTASNQFAVTDEDKPVSGDVLRLLSDPDGDPIHVVDFQIEGSAGNHSAGDTVTIVGSGTFVLNANGSYTFTPVADWNGMVPTITFNVSDGTATPPTQSSLDITVRPIDDIASDSVSTHAGKPITIDPFINDDFTNIDKEIVTTGMPAHGSVTVSTDGKTILYTPNPGYVGDDVFTYTVKSGGIEETASITVTMTNAVPVIRSTAGHTLEDTTLNGNLLANASDGDGTADIVKVTDFTVDGVTYTVGTPAVPVVIAGKGTLTISSTGTYSFVPVADWNGIVPPISFTISDGNIGGQATSNLVIVVEPVADIAPDKATTHADNSVAINVLGNDTFSNAVKTVTAVRDSTTLGQVFVLSDNTIRYSPPPGYVGIDTFTYTVTSGGITETSTVEVVITNTAPVTTDTDVSMNEDGPQISGSLTVTDVDSDVIRVTSFQVDGMNGVFTINRFGTGTAVIPGVGTFTLSYDRNYTFTPVADWNGDVPQITYVVTDDNGDTQVSGKVIIVVNPVVDIANDAITLQAGTSSSDNLLTNDSFENSDRTITGVTQGTHGTVSIGSNGIVTYTPQPDYVGTDSYQYTVTSGGRTEIATVSVTVTNTVPVANPDPQTDVEDTKLVGNVLDNDTDSNATDTLRVTSFTLPGETVAHLAGETVTITGIGALTLNADGSYEFVPVADWNGAVPVVTYNISDGHTGGTASSTLTLVLTEVADIADDASSTHAGTPVIIDVLANDTFENSDRQITATSNGTFGTTTIINGKVVYTPVAGYVGRDTFTYTVTSGGINETATVTVDMTNTPPVANPDTSTTPEDSTASGNVLANDTDADNADKNALTVTGFTVNGTLYTPGTALTLTGMGVLTVQANGNWNFVPVADWNGTLPVVTYQISDGNTGGVSSASLSITIAPVQDAFNDLISVNGNSSVTSDVLANDTFTNSDKTIVATTQGNHGTVTVENGKITYTPDLGYVGADSYTYTVLSGGILETATVAVRVADLAPIVNPEAVITPENTPISGNVLTNDRDPNGDPLHISVFQVGGTRYNAGETALLAGIGSLTVQADGSYTFTPETNWHGFVPAVTYTVSDGYPVGETNGTLRILVAPSVEIQVREDGLTPLDPGAQEVSGTLDLLSLDKLKTFTFQGRVITAEQLLQLNPLSPITIETVTGTITLLAYYSPADGEGHVDYRFTLREAVSQPGLVSTHNDYAVEVNGVNVGQLRITVFNDSPTATDDSAEILQDQNQESASGNVFNDDRMGADGAANNGPVTGVVSENTGSAGTIGGASGGQYGTLTLDSKGNWTYQVNRSDPRVASLEANATLTEVFVYTITDSDGDVSEARLTILIHGVTAMPNVDDRNGDQIFGPDEEETLTTYSQSYEPGLFILPLVYDLQSDAVGLQTRLNSQFAAYGYGIEHANAPVMQQAVLFSRWYNDSRAQRSLPGLESNGLGQNSLGNSFGPFSVVSAVERSPLTQTVVAQEAPQVEQPAVIALGAKPLSMQLAALEKHTLASGKHITVPTINRR